ncbi:MAG: hypothetical protein O7D91_21530 [Planctomycetota bacterium]|nr:hypothetical protein [Planctomycetota bacterium]
MKHICPNCHWWQRLTIQQAHDAGPGNPPWDNDGDSPSRYGFCHFPSPSYQSGHAFIWPVTTEDDWCGSYLKPPPESG